MLSVMYQSLTHYNVTLFPRHSACHHRDIWLFSYRAVSRRDSPASRVPTMEIMEIMEMIVNIIFTEMDYSCDRNFSRRAMKLRLTNGHKEINCTDIYCYTEDENSSDSDRDMDSTVIGIHLVFVCRQRALYECVYINSIIINVTYFSIKL